MEQKFGLENFCSCEYLKPLYDQLRKLRFFTNSRLTYLDLDDLVEDAINGNNIKYYGLAGRPFMTDGTLVTKETANYAEFDTKLTDNLGRKIYGYLFRRNNKSSDFRSLFWGYSIADMRMDYKQGSLCFTRRIDAHRFFTELANRAIDENWGINDKQNELPFPVLRSYIIHILKKIKTDEPTKFARNDREDMVLFNTNLFDDKFNEIYIAGKIDGDYIKDPYIVADIVKLRDNGFSIEKHHIERTVPLVEAPTFYDGIEDIVYQKHWAIKQGDDLEHVVERCKYRIETEEYKRLPNQAWSMLLKNAISFAMKVAKSNYKFIVPQYRFVDEADEWEKEKGSRAQLLMPIYLKCDISQQPDGVLILDIEKETQTYCPKTILTLDMVYRNARLIAKPSEEWLCIQ